MLSSATMTAGYKIAAPYLYVIPIALTIVVCGLAALYYRSILLRRRQHMLDELTRSGAVLPESITTGTLTFGYMMAMDVRTEVERRWLHGADLSQRPRMWEAFVEKVDSEDSEWEWNEIMPFSGTYLSEVEKENDSPNPRDGHESRLRWLFYHRGSSVPPSSSEPTNITRPGNIPSPPQNKLHIGVLIAMPSFSVPVPVSDSPDALGPITTSNAKASKPNTDADEPDSRLPHLEIGVVDVVVY